MRILMRILGRGWETSRAFKLQSSPGIQNVSSFSVDPGPRSLNLRKISSTNQYILRACQKDMDAARECLVEKIHATETKLVLYVTGGGMHLGTWLLSIPGASKTVLDVRIPYSRESLQEVVSSSDTQDIPCASKEMSIRLSQSAFRKATCLSSFGTPVMGVGITCALATDRARRGEDKIFVSTYGPGSTMISYSLILEKGRRGRLEEDIIASNLALDGIAMAMGVLDNIESPEKESGDVLCITSESLIHGNNEEDVVDDCIQHLIDGFVDTVEFSGGSVFLDAPRPNRMYLPGSFNPLHEGHKKLLHAAESKYPGKEGAFELSIGNADKGLLSKSEIVCRVKQFISQGLPLVLTKAPLFTMKSELFPGSTFVVGYDTAIRLVQERYYGSTTDMILQFAKLTHQGCDFVVAGRVDRSTGKYYTLSDVTIPDSLANYTRFLPLSPDEFRADISSTEIRERANPK